MIAFCEEWTKIYSLKILSETMSSWAALRHTAQLHLQWPEFHFRLESFANAVHHFHALSLYCAIQWRHKIDGKKNLGNILVLGPLFTSCLLACILLAYWLFISTTVIKHIMVYSAWLYFRSLNPTPYLNNYRTKN